MSSIAHNLAAVRESILRACAAANRPPDSVRLLAVSKTFDADTLRAAAAAGQREFGENYLQEALAKKAELADLGLCWHFIGPVQSNKTRALAETFDWVHGVDRLRIAQRLSDQRPAHLPRLNVCVQVNISDEDSKSGCLPNEAAELCRAIALLPRLRLRGLMAIPAPASAGSDPREPYHRLRTLFEAIRGSGVEMDTISAGMSDDLEAAIMEGSTLVRIGTAIFGKRTTP